MTSLCHNAGLFPGLGLCLHILCVTVHASSWNQNFIVLSGSLTSCAVRVVQSFVLLTGTPKASWHRETPQKDSFGGP